MARGTKYTRAMYLNTDFLLLTYPCDVVLHGVHYSSVAEALRHADNTNDTHLVGLLLQKYEGALGEKLLGLPDRAWVDYEPYSWLRHGLLKQQRKFTRIGAAMARVVLLLRVRNLCRTGPETVDA